jgi:hypothetical protein
LHNEELQNVYSLPSIIKMIMPRRMRWIGHVAQMEKRSVKNPEGNIPLLRPRKVSR